MVFSTRNVGIIASLVVSTAMVGGVLLFTSPILRANAVSTDELLKAYAAKDTDSDGLTDWQEALYGTDPNNAESVKAGVKDGDAVTQGLVKPKFTATPPTTGDDVQLAGATAAPETLTDRFARKFLEQYLSTRGAVAPTEDEMNKFINDAMTDLLSTSAATSSMTETDAIIAPGNGPEAIQAYGLSTEAGRKQLPSWAGGDPLDYFSNYLTKNDQGALAQVRQAGKNFTFLGQNLIKLPVPREALAAHVRTANAVSILGQVLTNMGAIDTDPLRGMLGLQQYQSAIKEFLDSTQEMTRVFTNEHVRLGVPYDILPATTTTP